MIIKKCDICGKVADNLHRMSVEYEPKDESYKYTMLPLIDTDYLCEDCIDSVLRVKKEWKETGVIHIKNNDCEKEAHSCFTCKEYKNNDRPCGMPTLKTRTEKGCRLWTRK